MDRKRMAEYIEREKAISVLCHLFTPNKSPAQRKMLRTAGVGIQCIPAADVEPVKHDLTNQTFGFLKVIEPVKNERIKSNETRWKCLCQNCGRTVEVSSYWLRHETSSNLV